MLTSRENTLRALEFRYPEWIPCNLVISLDTWLYHGKNKLQALLMHYQDIIPHERLNPDLEVLPPCYELGNYTDNWGNQWKNVHRGAEGVCVRGALEDYNRLLEYHYPDVETKAERGPRNWKAIEEDIRQKKAQGEFVRVDGGRLFDMLYFLRGYENLMIDMATDNPHLPDLIRLVWDYGKEVSRHYIDLGVDQICYHTDIGSQIDLMISPAMFRKYIKPWFFDLFSTIRKWDIHVHLSSDGNIGKIIDDLIECGVTSHDPQFRAFGGVEGIRRAYGGKRIAVVLDLDRQLFPLCSAQEAYRHVVDAVTSLASVQGGLLVQASVNGPVPYHNIEAICEGLRLVCGKPLSEQGISE